MFVKKEETLLWLVDVQEGLFPYVEGPLKLLESLKFVLQWSRLLEIPLIATEQAPEKLGPLLPALRMHFSPDQQIFSKTTFSSYVNGDVQEEVNAKRKKTMIVMGIETHICVFQTVKDLKQSGKEIIVLSDACSSRNTFDHKQALLELRDLGVRVTTAETLLYELVRDASDPLFKQILPLVKARACSTTCC